MIPQVQDDLRQDFTIETLPSRTFRMYHEWDWEAVKPYVLDTINAYFKELAETWADQDEPLVVRISQLESRILSVSGILDISNTTINEEAANYPLPLDHIPVVGAVIARG